MSEETVPDTDPYTGGLVLQLGVLAVMGGLLIGGAIGLVVGVATTLDGGGSFGFAVFGAVFGAFVGAVAGLFAAALALPLGAVAACCVTRSARRRDIVATGTYLTRMRVAVGVGGASLLVAGFWILGLGLFLGGLGAAYGVFAGDRVGRWVQRQATASSS